MRVGRNRGRRKGPERVVGLQVSQHEVIVYAFTSLSELLAVTDRHRRLCRGVGIRENVVEVDPGIAVGDQTLEDHARCDVKRFDRMKQKRNPATGAVSVIHILWAAAIRLERLNEPRRAMVYSTQTG